MAVFFYKCKHNNDIENGFIEAKNIQEASNKLEKSGLTILELKEQNNLKSNVYLNYELTPLTIKEKKDFYNSFYKQYKAGIPFHEIFNNIMVVASSGNIKAICFNIIKKLQKNNTIEDVFICYSKYIGKTEANLIIAGEKSGKLENTLSKISQQVKEQEEFRANLISKAKYPAIVFGLIIFSCMVFAFFVFPAFNATIDNQDVDFKALCFKAIIKIAISMGVIGVVVLNIAKNKQLQKTFLNWVLGLKFLKPTIENYNFSNYFFTLALAQDAGVPLDESLELSSQTISSFELNKKLNKAEKMIQEGCEIATAFEISGIFSEYAISQISAAEKTGELSKTYEDVALDYRKEYLAQIDTLVKLVEPSMLCFAAIIILIVGVKMYSKYYETLFSLF